MGKAYTKYDTNNHFCTVVLFNLDASHNEGGRCASCCHAPKKGGKVPSLRVNIQVLASHFTPQGSKAATSPTRSGSRGLVAVPEAKLSRNTR
jgi:hypothetical protein